METKGKNMEFTRVEKESSFEEVTVWLEVEKTHAFIKAIMKARDSYT